MKRSAYIVLCLLSAFLFVSCNPEGTGIFMSIATERKIKDSDFLDRTVNRMLVNGSTYYACAGKIFTRQSGSPASWSALPVPSGYLMANDIALLSGNLYAVFLSDSSSGLFTWNGTTWAQVPVSGVTGMVTDLFVEGTTPTLFVQEQRDGTYEDEKTYRLYSSTNGFNFDSVFLDGSWDIAHPVRDVAHDGTNFWIISGSNLYSGTATAFGVISTAPSVSGKDFVGLFWDGTSKLYLAREGVESGAVFTFDGSSWTPLSSSLYLNPDVSDFAAYNNGTADIILLGRGVDEDGDDGGYYESFGGGGFGTPSSSYSAGSDYSDLTLSENPVRRLYAFGDDIFACPAGDGLWLRDYASGDWDRD